MCKNYKILFVCHGNICRSTMAEAIFKNLIKNTMLENSTVDSMATSKEAIDEDVYYKASETLEKHGICGFHHISKQITKEDYNYFDKIYIMDSNNYRNIINLLGKDIDNKIEKLLPGKDIEDPWYTRDFETAFKEIERGCKIRLDELLKD